MGLGHNTTIARSGLVFYYDMSNTQKSFRGAPTTNLIQNPTNATWNLYAFTEGGASASSSDEVQSNGYTAKVVNVTAGAGGYTNVQLYSNGIYTMTGGVTYSVSCMIWASTTCSIRIGVIKNGPPWSDYIALTVKNLSPGWNSISTSGSFGSTVTDGRFQLDFGFVPNNTTLKVMSPQLEQNSFATPFVNGVRSNTQAILDLTNTQTVTAESLTYSADGTFSFDGTNNYAYINSAGFFSSAGNNFFADVGYAWTVSAWFRFPVTPSGTRTGNQSWAIFGQAGGIGGAETLSLFVGSATDTSLYASVPYYCIVGIRGAKTIISPASVNTNTWNHVVVTWNGSAGRVYFNGDDRGAANIGTAAIQTGYIAGLGITGFSGVQNNAPQLFQGSIGVISVYNRAISSTEVLQNFNAQRDRYGI